MPSKDASKSNAAKKLCVDFAKHFPKDKPTPKQYFVLMHAVEFLAENDFCGEGDEQPMESLHHEWNRLWVKSRHCVQRKITVERCLNSMRVKNNVKILVLADKAQSWYAESRFVLCFVALCSCNFSECSPLEPLGGGTRISSATLPWQHEKPSQEMNLDTTMTSIWPIRFPKSK